MNISREPKSAAEDVVSAAHLENFPEVDSVLHKTTVSGIVLVPQPTDDPRDPLVRVGLHLVSFEASLHVHSLMPRCRTGRSTRNVLFWASSPLPPTQARR
jgi:hypothetical protein